MEELALKMIIKKIKKGKVRNFEKIVHAYEGKVYGFIYSIVKDKHHTEDLTQEVFLKVYRNLDKIDVTSNFSSWILTIARNASYDHIRKHSKLILVDNVDAGIEASPEEDYLKREFENSIDNYVQILPEHLRTLIVMKYFEDLSYKEISIRQDIDIKTVKSQLYDARRKLMKLINDEEGTYGL